MHRWGTPLLRPFVPARMLRQAVSQAGAHRKSLHEMLRRFKLAGAHPDILLPHSAEKAHTNGEALIELESFLNGRSIANTTVESQTRTQKVDKDLRFWLVDSKTRGLKSVACRIRDQFSDIDVHRELKSLFHSAGLNDEFALPNQDSSVIDERDLGSILGGARSPTETLVASKSGRTLQELQSYIESMIFRLRSFGAVVALRQRAETYLLTMPDNGLPSLDNPAIGFLKHAQLDLPTIQFLRERQLKAFNIRLVFTVAAVEALGRAVEKLGTIFEHHRGTAVRGGVCFVIVTGTANRCFVARDGCIVLPLAIVEEWETFLLSTPIAVWQQCQQLQHDWRGEHPTRLHERQRQLKRLANVFNVQKLVCETPLGSDPAWGEKLIQQVSLEEAKIRGAIGKYPSLALPEGKKFVKLHFHTQLHDLEGAKIIDYRLDTMGAFHFNFETMNVPKVLKVLKDHTSNALNRVKSKLAVDTDIEYLQRALNVGIQVCPNWCLRESEAMTKARVFLTMVRKNVPMLLSMLNRNGNRVQVINISDHAAIAPGGCVSVPYDATLQTLEKATLLT